MQVSIEEKGKFERQINITVPAARVDAMVEGKLKALSKNVKVPGFREGNVPAKVVKQRYGERVMGEVANELINSTLPEALTNHKQDPINTPHVHGGMAEEGKDFSYHAHYEIKPEISPKKYKDLTLSRDVAEVDDKLVGEILDRERSRLKDFSPKKDAVAKGDRVTFDAVGYLGKEKEPFAGGTLNDYKIEIGSGQLIPGFEEGLTGMKEGESKTLELTFPKDYHAKEMAGKKARFDVKVKMVEEGKMPELNDEIAKQLGQEDLKGLKELVRKMIGSNLENASQQRLKRALMDKLDETNKVELPNSLIENELNNLWHAQMQQLQQHGVGLEALGKNEDEVRAELRTLAERRTRLALILMEIGKLHNIEVKREELDAEIEKLVQRAPQQADQIRAYYGGPQGSNDLAGPLFEEKVVQWILSTCTIKDNKVKADELLKEFE